MKKTYSKPNIIFESFTMNTDIAGGCGMILHTPVDGECGYEFIPGMNLFVSGADDPTYGCNEFVEDGSADYDGICYYVPTENKQLFNS